MEQKNFDIAVIGSGPGGYIAAIKAAQLGKKVALIEKSHLGGTCLNVGCIPTKSLLSHAEELSRIKEAKKYSIQVGEISFDYGAMVATKNHVVMGLRKSLQQLLLSNQITILHGSAKFTSPKELKVLGQDNLLLQADKIIIATGSDCVEIPSFIFDCHLIHSSTSILCLSKLPSSLLIIGGGYIGCEFTSLFQPLGVKITIVEALPSLLATQGSLIGSELAKAFKNRGVDIRVNTRVESIEKKEHSITAHLQGGDTIDAEKALICIGRKPHTQDLDLEKAGIATTNQGAIPVNDEMETSVRGIYAIGDVTGKMMLAHVASHQGIVAASNAAGLPPTQMHYNAIPSVVFTDPQIASVGYTQEEAEKNGLSVLSTTYPLQALGKAQATLETTGWVQLITEKTTEQIVGAHAMGHEAALLIAEMGIAIQNELTLSSVMETIHAHPTLAESWMEAAFLAHQTPLHFPPRKKV